MTSTWSGSTERAFDVRRAWRKARRETGAVPGPALIADADVIVLSLILDRLGIDRIVCPSTTLRPLLETALQGGPAGCRVQAEADGEPCLWLSSIDEAVGDALDRPGATAWVLYGLDGRLPATPPRPGPGRSSFRLLAGASPALWQCGLVAAVAPDEAAADALVEALRLSMRGEWIDPLALYEKVQQLTAQLRAMGEIDGAAPPVAEDDDRVARLEFEIAALKRAALLRQHALLAEAAQRASGKP